uniref:flavonoid 3',5'-hydroxylase 1-like n=1 Tax=Erigeron canadensis TaxID=72917 RepID=UPI001CB8DB04|nr:flavonoid 3',5'-hydroxylase 1-like [Erigeron canadensis]
MVSHELAFTALLVTLVLILISWYKSDETSNSRKAGTPPLPPGPKGLPLVGSLPFLGPNIHEELTNISHQYGPIFKLYLGSKLHIVVNSAEMAKVITVEQDESFANRAPHIAGLATSYGGNDIAFAPNNANRRNLRKVLVQEVLSNVNLEASHAYRRHEVRKAVKYVYDRVGMDVDINEISFSTVLNVLTNIIWRKGFVDDGTNYANLSEKIQKVICRIVEIAEGLNISDFFPMIARFDLQGVERKMKDQMKQFDKIIETTIKERMNSKSTNVEETVEQKGRKDFLQILLEHTDQKTGTSITMTQLKALVSDIFLGGTDATSAMVEWAMTEIFRDQKVMKRVQDELEEIVGLNNIVEESHIPKLKYLEAVCKETFRLHPPIPFLLPRAPNKPCTVGGYTVPEGATIFVNVWAIQRDPRHWEDPSEFNPDRFLNCNGSTEKWDYSGTNLTFLPFGSGRRRCPGIPLGEKMMMHILASLMHSFDWKLPNGEELDLSERFGIALKKKKPLVAVPTKRLSDPSLYM